MFDKVILKYTRKEPLSVRELGMVENKLECPECGGIGKIRAENCSKCNGHGEIIIHSHPHTHGNLVHNHPHPHPEAHALNEEIPHDHLHE